MLLPWEGGRNPCYDRNVGVRGQHWGVIALLPPVHGFKGLNSGCQAHPASVLPTKPSCCWGFTFKQCNITHFDLMSWNRLGLMYSCISWSLNVFYLFHLLFAPHPVPLCFLFNHRFHKTIPLAHVVESRISLRLALALELCTAATIHFILPV